MKLNELELIKNSGGLAQVLLRGCENGYFVEIFTKSGEKSVLEKLHEPEPRIFTKIDVAIQNLVKIGIFIGQFDLTNFKKIVIEKEKKDGRGSTIAKAIEAKKYNDWLANEIASADEDTRPDLSATEVIQHLDSKLKAWNV